MSLIAYVAFILCVCVSCIGDVICIMMLFLRAYYIVVTKLHYKFTNCPTTGILWNTLILYIYIILILVIIPDTHQIVNL